MKSSAQFPCDVSFSCELQDQVGGANLLQEAADLFHARVYPVGETGRQVMLQECGLKTYLTFDNGRMTLVANSPEGDYERQLSACACATSKMGELSERITGRIHFKANYVERGYDLPDADPVLLDILNVDDFTTGSLRSAVGRWHPGLN